MQEQYDSRSQLLACCGTNASSGRLAALSRARAVLMSLHRENGF
jgi:hypothetical protein